MMLWHHDMASMPDASALRRKVRFGAKPLDYFVTVGAVRSEHLVEVRTIDVHDG
jgi:hypothetical protein